MAIKASTQITISKVIDIYACYRYYKLQSSTLAKPSKPTTNPPSGWSDTEPAYVSGSTNTLYFVDCNVYSDKSFSFSEVSKSSSYEAAKDAWNKANNAQETVDNLEIGGRNLVLYSLVQAKSSIYGFAGRKLTMELQAGTTYTVSFCGRVIDGEGRLAVYLYEPTWKSATNRETTSKTNTIVSWTFKPSLTAKYTIEAYSYLAQSTHGGNVYLDWYKVEKGNKATDWTPAPEDSIAKVDVEYYLSTSATSLAGGSWTTTAPTWVNGKYMWSRTVTVDGAGNKTYSPNQNGVCIAGAKGDTGAKGDKGDKGATGQTGPQGPQGGTGATGKGVSSIVEQYYKSTSSTALSGGSWSNTYPGWENGKYIWTRSVITYTDKTSTTTTPVCVTGTKGDTGVKGDKGETGPAGKGINSTAVTYQASTSGTSIPTGTWATSIPSVAAGSYLWTRTIITYTDKTSTTSYAVGKMGSTGATGKGIKSTSITYQAHSNGTTAPTGTWTSNIPQTSASKPYLWSRTVLTYTDNTTSTTYSVGSTPDGVLEEIRKVLRYDNTKIVLGQDGEPTSLELTNEGLTVKSDSEDIISVTGENREVTSDYNPSGATFTRRYGKIINADGTIISCGNTVSENDYEIAEMVQYTGVDPLLSGHEAGIDITTKIAGVDKIGTNKTETDRAYIHLEAKRDGRNDVHSRIYSAADWIDFTGEQIKFYPKQEFEIDGTQNGASIGFKGKGIGLYPTEELELGIPVITGDCNKLIKSCTWYLGNGSTNRPLNQNGWLISRPYSTDYCHQTYITCTGGIYRRMMQAGKWSIWQGGYANVKKLWSGTLSKGGSVNVANLSLFDTFILGTSSGTAMLIGTRYYDPNNNRGTTVLFTAGHDDGTTSYLYKATTSMSGTTFKLTSCSVHTLDPTGCGGHAATVKSLYGVL